MNQSKLPADPTALVLGISALIIGFAGCCCYGVLAIIPLIISIIGLVLANSSLKEYSENPEAYSPQSRSNVSTAKILNIIALVYNGIVVIWFIIVLAFFGTMLTTGVLNDFEGFDFNEMYETENDTLFDGSEYYESEVIIDSL